MSNEIRIVAEGGQLSYAEVTSDKVLPAGVYECHATLSGDIYYIPIKADNDQPLEIDDNSNIIVNEFKAFFDSRDTFKKYGFAHKRGYLLYGPPGCGKSSTLRLLGQKFVSQYNGLVLIWNARMGVEAFVTEIRSHEPDRPILAICEDIDDCIHDFESEILEFLDGQKALNNFILVATTNHLSSIPERIRNRPSRIDRVMSIGLPKMEARSRYLAHLGVPADLLADIAAATKGVSLAHLKEVVVGHLCLGQPLSEVVERVRGLKGAGTEEEDGDDETVVVSNYAFEVPSTLIGSGVKLTIDGVEHNNIDYLSEEKK